MFGSYGSTIWNDTGSVAANVLVFSRKLNGLTKNRFNVLHCYVNITFVSKHHSAYIGVKGLVISTRIFLRTLDLFYLLSFLVLVLVLLFQKWANNSCWADWVIFCGHE